MIALLAAAAAAVSAPTEPAKQLEELRLIYSQSCEVRAYATFDRLCEGLKKQMREAEKAHRRGQRERPTVAATAQRNAPGRD